jgi:hypothetical protein
MHAPMVSHRRFGRKLVHRLVPEPGKMRFPEIYSDRSVRSTPHQAASPVPKRRKHGKKYIVSGSWPSMARYVIKV